jgi:hypothetical protein
MPAPAKQMLAETAKSNFLSKGIQVPVKWEKPGNQFDDAFSLSERLTAPNSPLNLFDEPSLNKYHVDAAGTIGEKLAAYVEGICGAICSAIDNWMKLSSVAGLLIMGPTGQLPPGSVLGPPLMPLIFASAPKNSSQETKYSQAIASALGQGWQMWQAGLTGVLMYPAFAAFPGPMAPPTPNVPVPLITLASAGESALSPAVLKDQMMANLGDSKAQHAGDLFDALSKAFSTCFQTFKASTMVQNVLGTGPIPTFAPPFVPVGPVVGGTSIPVPGVLV